MTIDRELSISNAESADQSIRAVRNRDSDDARMELLMGRLLQTGVLLAAAVVLAGGVPYLFQHAGETAHYGVFIAQPFSLRHPRMLLSGLVEGNASSIMQLGILLLVATPICRVLFALVAFVLEGDRLYVVVSLLVLTVLLFSIFRGG